MLSTACNNVVELTSHIKTISTNANNLLSVVDNIVELSTGCSTTLFTCPQLPTGCVFLRMYIPVFSTLIVYQKRICTQSIILNDCTDP